jgi:hypothetical protein
VRILLERSGGGLRDRKFLLELRVITRVAGEAGLYWGAAPRETD